eukprot:GFYU01003622.1.p2 GENE.GFYU01003622.1~~GFYU01003622.1.p2  ORF type:complete len:247 (-),score=26.41 GFYU01003622.1:501-1241(-)
MFLLNDHVTLALFALGLWGLVKTEWGHRLIARVRGGGTEGEIPTPASQPAPVYYQEPPADEWPNPEDRWGPNAQYATVKVIRPQVTVEPLSVRIPLTASVKDLGDFSLPRPADSHYIVRIIHGGQALYNENESLQSYGISDNTTVHAVLSASASTDPYGSEAPTTFTIFGQVWTTAGLAILLVSTLFIVFPWIVYFQSDYDIFDRRALFFLSVNTCIYLFAVWITCLKPRQQPLPEDGSNARPHAE